MAAGLFGYLGYDMVRLVERLPDVNPDPLGLPDALMLRPVGGAGGRRRQGRGDGGQPGLGRLRPQRPRRLRPGGGAGDGRGARPRPHARPSPRRDLGPDLAPGEPVSNTSHARYLEMVETAKEYIRAGDIFQVVPSQRWAQPFELPPFELYRALRRTNPSPFMFYFNFGGFQVIGASPGDPGARRGRQGDRSARSPARARAARRRPRTRRWRRSCWPTQGAGRARDAGRPGPQRRRPRGEDRHGRSERAVIIERYSHVMHITSNVDGQLADGPGRALGAARGPARRHRVGRAEGPGDADHRRARERAARGLRRRRRLHRRSAATWTPASRCGPRW